MNLELITKRGKKNKTTSKSLDDDVMLKNFDVIVNFSDLWPIWRDLKVEFQTHNL